MNHLKKCITLARFRDFDDTYYKCLMEFRKKSTDPVCQMTLVLYAAKKAANQIYDPYQKALAFCAIAEIIASRLPGRA